MPFLMAMGTSRALPIPNPAWPCWSPTTTSAEKLRFLPPLTTLVTRLMATTSSFKFAMLTSRCRRTDKMSLSCCLDISLELQPRFPGRIAERLYAPVELIPAAIKHHLLDLRTARPPRNRIADNLVHVQLPTPLEPLAH